MSGMFCFQCQEAAKNTGCTVRGVCGKQPETAGLQDLLVHALRSLALAADGRVDREVGEFLARGLFATITNANFDDARFPGLIRQAVRLRERLKEKGAVAGPAAILDWQPAADDAGLAAQAPGVSVLATLDEDVRSLRELIVYGLKGVAAYAEHAAVLGYEDQAVYDFLAKGLAASAVETDAATLTALVLGTGNAAVQVMALLDKANTETYGRPEATQVNIGVRGNPGILVSGHDLKDLEELLEQTKGSGIDVYTHGEMLPANAYPFFKKYANLAGNYGGSWWKQGTEFASFNGPILMTTNCIIPVKDEYRDRIYTTGQAGWPGAPHIPDRVPGGRKDFAKIIAKAKTCPPPVGLESGTIPAGFAHDQIMAVADKVVAAIKSGAIKRFVVMGGCDGRHASRDYFTQVAEQLPQDAVILTAGCAKFRYNKLALGEIDGIPRLLDAGQCNDSYSLAVVALKLKEAFALEDINELPISFDIAWYEQKAVAVLLALLSLGVKGIRLGPTLPLFVSPGVAKVLVENFGIRQITDAETDVAAMMAGA
jgi:hydroxylamine reductase